MFDLMRAHFDNVAREQFEYDLYEKQWVIVLCDRQNGEIQGFSTLLLLNACCQGIPVKAVFSGDTIVHRDYWGEPELAGVWGNFVLSLINSHDGSKFYWFLISKGYRTYKFLPVYFHCFYPRHDQPTPSFESELIATLATSKFGAAYVPEEGVIRFNQPKDHLRPQFATVSDLRSNDPHVSFFLERNPGYRNGDELACIAELSEENLQPIAKRICNRVARQATTQFSS
ncbi:MAG: hypothetical protein HY692_01765 [Cyanobacteria bacterium NC_groundwater_1444_Ag_S-0.65um_54_12]|nr:hypothetical protein [Cyanobacteria bacterium NC_groundwater_1444_Ag_S-0.65um_54_12]